MLLASFQYPKSVLINRLQICPPEPSFVICCVYFYVSLSLVVVPTARLLMNIVT